MASMYLENYSMTFIAECFKCSHTAVSKNIRKFLDKNTFERKVGSGRRGITTPRGHEDP
jgi:predicted DNA-binding protein YlxM (UPF0122 family)